MKKILLKIKSLDKGTILRTLLVILSIANQIVALIGKSSFASADWYQWLSFGLTLLSMILSYWYNNDWSKLAILTRDIFDSLKDGKISEDEAKKLLEKNTEKEGKEQK